MPEVARFHLAVPVDDLEAAAHFYGEVLGCRRGRSDERWTDWDLFGHQLVTHLVGPAPATPSVGTRSSGAVSTNPVDGDAVPVPHFGVILEVATFHELVARLRRHGVGFAIEPRVRFAGDVGEQWTMFFFDPSGNAIECKAFADDAQVFDHR